jgi:hypothetical protein
MRPETSAVVQRRRDLLAGAAGCSRWVWQDAGPLPFRLRGPGSRPAKALRAASAGPGLCVPPSGVAGPRVLGLRPSSRTCAGASRTTHRIAELIADSGLPRIRPLQDLRHTHASLLPASPRRSSKSGSDTTPPRSRRAPTSTCFRAWDKPRHVGSRPSSWMQTTMTRRPDTTTLVTRRSNTEPLTVSGHLRIA